MLNKCLLNHKRNERSKTVGLPHLVALHGGRLFWNNSTNLRERNSFAAAPGSMAQPARHQSLSCQHGMVDVVRLVSNSPLVFSPPPFLWDSSAPAFPSRSQSYFCRNSAEQMSLNGHLTSLTIMSFTQTANYVADVPWLQSWKREKDESV